MTERGDHQETIPDRVKHWAELYQDKEVFIFYSDAGRRALTCKDVHVLSRKFAALLQRRGLKPGDVVCNTLPNSPERVVTDFGIMAAGCVTANAQALLTDGSDMLHVINLSKCRMLVTDNTSDKTTWELIKRHLGDVRNSKVASESAPYLEMVQFVGVSKENGFMENLLQEADPVPNSIQPSDTAVYWCTSGSSGFSKLVPYIHKTLLLLASDLHGMKGTDIMYSDRPFGWGGGFPFGFLNFGMTQVSTDSRGSVADSCKLTWHAVHQEKCTFGVLTAAFAKKLLERPDVLQRENYLIDRIRLTGQPFRKHCFDLIGKICNAVASSYGLTECAFVSTGIYEKGEDFKDNIVGKLSRLLNLKIMDEDLKEVPTGTNGQILIKGSHLPMRYVNNSEETRRAVTDDGWFKTGDIGFQDADGNIFIEGRRSDAIMHGEYIIYPSWVERTLRSCPYVAEVMVVGIPDEVLCHRICACVIPKSGTSVTTDMLKEYCDPMFTDNILNEMTAKPEFYILVNSYPIRPTGKPDRRALAELAAKMLNCAESL